MRTASGVILVERSSCLMQILIENYQHGLVGRVRSGPCVSVHLRGTNTLRHVIVFLDSFILGHPKCKGADEMIGAFLRLLTVLWQRMNGMLSSDMFACAQPELMAPFPAVQLCSCAAVRGMDQPCRPN